MKHKEIFKRQLALQLRDLGNPILYAKVNLDNKKFVIYIFEDTNKLENDLKNIMNK